MGASGISSSFEMLSKADSRFMLSRSTSLMKKAIDFPSLFASLKAFSVPASMPVEPSTVRRAASQKGIEAASSPAKSKYPGVSMKVIRFCLYSTALIDAEIEIPLFFSSSVKSETVLPSVTVPCLLIAPALKSSDSTRVVFPDVPCPATQTLRKELLLKSAICSS